MSSTTSSAMKAQVKQTADKVAMNPATETLTRLGYAVRGLIYILIGVFALQLATGQGGKLASQQEAIASIGKGPAGKILLGIVLVGLIAYCFWGVVRALLDPLKKGHDLKGLLDRGGYLVSAFGYAVLIPPTYRYLTGGSGSSGSAQNQQYLSAMMAIPWGRYVVGGLGIAVLGAGLYQIYQGIRAGFDRQFQSYTLTAQEVKLATELGRIGTAARGVVFAVVGLLIFLAAYRANPNQPTGTDSALAALLHQPYGVWILGVIAAGLIAFGLFSILCALWLRLKR